MDNVLKPLFFSETLRRWHFEEIVRASGRSRERVSHFLKALLKEGFVKRAKQKGKMPYYTANRDSPLFRFEKRLYGLALLAKSGLFEHISNNNEIQTAIIFGSFARGDWNKSSDIDLFIYGNDRKINKAEFERKAGREIQLFSFKDAKEMKRQLDARLLPNIAKGFGIKEGIDVFEVKVNG